jgi:hypothetical protein
MNMKTTTQITFDASPTVLAVGAVALLVVTVAALWAWHRSGFDRAVGALELLRVVIAVLAVVTLCQPEWTERFEPTEKPVLAILSDESLSMDTRDVLDPNQPGAEPVSRSAWIQQQLPTIPWDRLSDSVQIVRESFASGSAGPDHRQGTNIDRALADVHKRHVNLRAVILLSDGDWNEGDSPANTATRLRINHVPVYAVPLGSEEPLPDIEVASLEPPTFSVVGKSLQVPFSLRSTLAVDYEVEVKLTVETGAELSQRVVVPAMGAVRDVFFWTPDEVGDVRLALSVPPHPEEVLRDNNTAQVTVSIKAESIKVLVVESTPRWEYRYLRNALERDPGVEVSCVLFHPGLTKPGGGPSYLPRFPQTADELSKYDVVFLGDVGVGQGQLSAEDCRQIKGLVEKQASGLVFMPGMHGYEFSLLDTELDDLYPVVLDPNARRGFGSRVASSVVLTELGQASLLTKLADTAAENAAVWRSLPGFQWRSPAIRPRAGSDVLAIHEQSRAPLLVTKTYGTGKVLFMGTDGAWRWREGVEDKYHYRFWGQVARWMAYQRHMAEGELLRVFYTPDRPTAGNTVTLHATVLDPTGAPAKESTVTADLVDPQGRTQKLRFQSAGEDWGLYTTRFSPRQVGAYQLTLRCQETAAVLETLLDVQGKQREIIGKPARHDVLREIVKITRGQEVPYQEMQRLCEQVLQLPPPEPAILRKPIWASPYWAGTLIVLMGAFWIGRKTIGAI